MVWPRFGAPGTANAGAPPAIGADGGGLGCFVPGPHRPPREDWHAVLLAESLREADMIELGLVGPAAEPIGPRSPRGPCRSPKGDRVQVLADVGDHQVHVRAGESEVNWARANGASTRRKALDGGGRCALIHSSPASSRPGLTTSLKRRPTPRAATDHPLRVMHLAIWLSEHGGVSDVED